MWSGTAFDRQWCLWAGLREQTSLRAIDFGYDWICGERSWASNPGFADHGEGVLTSERVGCERRTTSSIRRARAAHARAFHDRSAMFGARGTQPPRRPGIFLMPVRDLEIWRRLHAGTITPAELELVARWPLARRGAYLGTVVTLVEHPEPAIRIATLHAVAGARGVPGVRAIVKCLDDEDAAVRDAAVTALRETARDAPYRYVHALFHPRPEVRLAALAQPELTIAAAELGIYLRADPVCAELARQAPWPANSLSIALELHAIGCVTAHELVALLWKHQSEDVRTTLAAERQRLPAVVDAYLDRSAVGALAPAPGLDHLDTILVALVGVSEIPGSPTLAGLIDRFVQLIAPRKQRLLARRAAASILDYLARHPDATPLTRKGLLAVAVAIEPRIVGFAMFTPADAAAASFGLVRFGWPVKPGVDQVVRLMGLPVAHDLALAAALAGLLGAKRLARLEKRFGELSLVEKLLASDHGWDEICALPGETPAMELAWLAKIEAADYKRYVTLAGRTVAIYTGTRLDAFVEQMPRRHRVPAFIAALRAHEASDGERIAGVAKVIATRIDRAGLTSLVEALLDLPDRTTRRRLVLPLIREVADKLLAQAVVPLDEPRVIKLIEVLEDPDDPPPRAKEMAIAETLRSRFTPAVHAWLARILTAEAPLATVAPPPQRRALDPAERSRIMSASPGDLAKLLAPAFGAPVTGLASALAVVGANPNAAACAALMGCGDPLVDVARQLDRFWADKLEIELDRQMMRWLRVEELPPLAHAYLYRWEAHLGKLAEWIDASGGVHATLRAAEALGDGLAGQTLWHGISEALMFFRYRDLPRYQREGTVELAQFCAERVDRAIGRHAARIVVALVEGKAVPVTEVRDRVLDRIADADAETREYAARLIRLDGIAAPRPVVREAGAADLIATIRKTSDLDALVQWCAHPQPAIVEEAVLALLVLGARGQLQLAALLDRLADLLHPLPILASIQLWEEPAAVDRARSLATRRDLPTAWRFYVNLALAARSEPGALDAAFAAAREPAEDWYFRRDDWEALLRIAEPLRCALELAESPHHHAYQRAVSLLISASHPSDPVLAALARFLEVDGDRPLHLRRGAAVRLAQTGDTRGMPLLVEQILDEQAAEWGKFSADHDVALEAVVGAVLVGGPSVASEKRMWQAFDQARRLVPRPVLQRIAARILDEATTNAARRAAANLAISEGLAHDRLGRVAEVFAWGVRRGVELTGRLFKFHLTSKETEYGYTRLTGDRIFVSPLPMLRDEANGQDIVEGLVLHEIGHHVYHRGEVPEALWAKAHKEGLGHLLNLVADEHLERNLRAIDPAYGDRLKRLGAYAFHHAAQELAVPVLLDSLRGAAAPALIRTPLDVGFAENSVRLRRGHVLTELDRNGHPLARFARSFRLGLGNRMNDPKLAEALALTQGIREMDMPQMYELTQKLAHLFGGALEVAKVFGGPEGLEAGDHERDDDVFGAGVTDDALQKEIERILDPRRNRTPKPEKGTPSKLWINVAPDEDFDRITTVERVRGNPEAHRKLVAEVDRHASRLRMYLDDLGLRWEPQRARTQGRALDRTRLLPLVTRNDPRILVARTPQRRTDLFLGVLVDCSGSMSSRDNIGRAKRFAALVAEAVRPLPGVEARFFGFTDSVIYDAGTARDCNVVGLHADGGNNDAAGLYHAATVALNSPKRAKVLVMISDGLPTECSVEALRGLVTTLTRRRGIVCAQVAVHPLEEVCFPNYVLLDGAIETAVARFGRMIGDLARKSLLA